MAVKECCVLNCFSSSTRKEDLGVTFHKFPKHLPMYHSWVSKTHHTPVASQISYVCSRHFCKSDFRLFMDSKYVLKSDAVPSIYPWTIMDKDDVSNGADIEAPKDTVQESAEININENESTTDNTEADAPVNPTETMTTDNTVDQTSETKDEDNLDDIKDFLDNHTNTATTQENNEEAIETVAKISDNELNNVLKKESSPIASNVMEMILSGTGDTISSPNKSFSKIARPTFSSPDKGNSNNALTVGTKVEAKDYVGTWHPAVITEVDFEEMEVLVHYDQQLRKPDEWISVSSSRLRPFGVRPVVRQSAPLTPIVAISRMPPTPASGASYAEEVKEERPKVVFVEGERCLARWRDNRRFIATIKTDMGDGNFEIMFDDGFIWKCAASRLSKLKESQCKTEPEDSPSVSSTPISTMNQSPGASSSTGQLPYHTHLFDPARDYLGSKSERRALKRKLNIKEIFNIGQKKMKKEYIPRERAPKVEPVKKPPAEKKPKVVKKKPQAKGEIKIATKAEIPDAVASIIGTVVKDENEPAPAEQLVKQELPEMDYEEAPATVIVKKEVDIEVVDKDDDEDSISEMLENRTTTDPVEEEQKLENFELPDEKKHEEVIDKIKEAINKLEDGLNEAKVASPRPKPTKLEPIKLEPTNPEPTKTEPLNPEPMKPESIKIEPQDQTTNQNPQTKSAQGEKHKKLSKIKKGKKLRLLQEKRVKKQVERVRSELEEMKRQVEAMRLEMLVKTEELGKVRAGELLPGELLPGELLPGEWACRWINGQPVGAVSELRAEPRLDAHNKPVLPRRSVQVEDKRLPEGWTKHMVRRSFGSSAGKWDVVLISSDNQRFHTRVEMRNYLDKHPALNDYEDALLDFGIHLKLARRLGWVTETPDGETAAPMPLPAGTLANTSPLVKKKPLSLKKEKKKIRRSKMKRFYDGVATGSSVGESPAVDPPLVKSEIPPLVAEEGYVFVGSLKVQILENLLRCPAEGCFKNFRNNTLLKMHIKHYHRELRKMLGSTPKVLDLAYERRPELIDNTPLKKESRAIKVKIPKPKFKKAPVSSETPKVEQFEVKEEKIASEVKQEVVPNQDSPKLRSVLAAKPVKRPKVLLPVRRPVESTSADELPEDFKPQLVDMSKFDPHLDFETAISTHTVTKPMLEKKCKKFSEDEDGWLGASSDVDTQSSFPRSLSPDSKFFDNRMPPMSSESNDDQKEPNMYMYDEFGRRIKIVHMKREEIINCHCGFREEDGLMVQCELCLCWQHAICHNIHREADVPERYTCSICRSPRRGRRSLRFLLDQEPLYSGTLPSTSPASSAAPCCSLRRTHELSGNLLRLQDALHAFTLKYLVATKKNHRKLYLWAKDWETTEISMTQEKLNSDYSDLNIMISHIGKENLPIKTDDNLSMDIRTPPSEELESDKYTHREGLSQTLLNGLLSSPGGASLDLPISTSELERLAKAVVEQELQQQVVAPQPEAAIENGACRERLLRHLQRCHALLDARLDSIEAQVAELESQDPSFEDDETADYFPRTKQTIQMLMRDLDVMEELGILT